MSVFFPECDVVYVHGTIQSGQQAAQALRTKMGLNGHREIWSEIKLRSEVVLYTESLSVIGYLYINYAGYLKHFAVFV